MAKKQNHLLILRGDIWYYQRRVPKKFRNVESRPIVRSSLNTDSLVIARRRRDALVEADDLYWSALAQEASENGGVSESTRKVQSQRYKAASLRALGYGFAYKTANQLIQEASADELMDRIEAATAKATEQSSPSTEVTDALLGGVEKPQADQRTVSECFRFYVDEIEFDAQINKSPGQRRSWENSKRVGIDYFVEAVGDIPMRDITRDHGIAYRNWWANRIKVGDENGKRPTPYTANRRIGSMRTLYRSFFSYIGQEDRPNPFRKLSFDEGDSSVRKRPPFSVEWIKSKFLASGSLSGLNDEARHILLAIVETGARPSELCNLLPEYIHLDGPSPHISIRPRTNNQSQKREVKAGASNRDIPLVGISLAAMRLNPNGFPRYYDKATHLSNTLMSYLSDNGLLESDKHTAYSLRHSFEDRMMEAGLDRDLRAILMGHKLKRPAYGLGGSMEFRTSELEKIALPYAKDRLL